MAATIDLSGHAVLVLEDSYYLATDMARALGAAGAEVLGPFPTEETALAAIGSHRPSIAILDINLGAGPSFAVARELAERGVPFLFVTGHGDAVIPPAFEATPRLRKPADPRQIVGRLAAMLGPDGRP